MNCKTSTKAVTVKPCHYNDEPALYSANSMLLNSKKLLELLELGSSIDY